jgi:hypothetical protein
MCRGATPHPDPPLQGGREICPASGVDAAAVVVEAEVTDQGVRRILAVRRTPAMVRGQVDFLRYAEFAGIEWTSGALA